MGKWIQELIAFAIYLSNTVLVSTKKFANFRCQMKCKGKTIILKQKNKMIFIFT